MRTGVTPSGNLPPLFTLRTANLPPPPFNGTTRLLLLAKIYMEVTTENNGTKKDKKIAFINCNSVIWAV